MHKFFSFFTVYESGKVPLDYTKLVVYVPEERHIVALPDINVYIGHVYIGNVYIIFSQILNDNLNLKLEKYSEY